MSTDKNAPHPTSMEADKLAELRASDPSAFDDDVEADNDDIPMLDEDEPELTNDDEVEPPKTKGNMVPEARVAEIVSQRKAAEDALALKDAELSTKDQELAQLRAMLASKNTPAVVVADPVTDRDFDAEYATLDQKYDDGDLSHDEYKKTQIELKKEERAYIKQEAVALAVQTIKQEQQKDIYAAQEKTWNDANQTWIADNQEFLKAPGARDAMQTAIDFIDKQNAANPLSPADMLARAHDVAAKMIGIEVIKATPINDKQQVRRSENARANATASNAPPSLTGGTGDRGAPTSRVDVANLKPGQFSKLSETEQEKLLGEGAV